MGTQTTSIKLPTEVVATADRVAALEERTRADVVRAALDRYVKQRRDWDELLAETRAIAKRRGITPRDVERAIREVRRARTK